ncbi:MAG: phosphoribosylformylglycinamidine cyclo-ligase [bacterium]
MSRYKKSGVDIDKATRSVENIGRIVKDTYSDNVLSRIGSFGAMYSADFGRMKNPVLISSADGVGTKLVIARRMNSFEHTGEDIVNHSVNDILATGAKPLYFLDYIGCGSVEEETVNDIIRSMADACKANDMSLIGGELAEMSVVYDYTHYDIVGFITGIAQKDSIITGDTVCEGDIVIGLPSSGFHTNGYTLIRDIIDSNNADLTAVPSFSERKLYELLLEPHRSYYRPVYPLIEKHMVKGIAHITGGGFYDNIRRILPSDVNVTIDSRSWETPPLFDYIVTLGGIETEEAYRVFNMGIGMVLIIDPDNVNEVKDHLQKHSEYFIIGSVNKGEGIVKID